ncbi:hypothetical protein [Ammoniphilus sp. CFH 90114]|uniref:hypothetical protein n=1 Tax=Ammoniphilus sp. CFH 90114 TaxID=2493665 RepID=UPI00100E4A8C|nr:hypothetical protein [Ammoniphilus sp. CFH 90114]RXT14879.1 hypothetical protein EIZ39_01315 [Ammoniphilus sp. CFH 90114]
MKLSRPRLIILRTIVSPEWYIIGFIITDSSTGHVFGVSKDQAIIYYKRFGGFINARLITRRTILQGNTQYLMGRNHSLMDPNMVLLNLEKCLRQYTCSLELQKEIHFYLYK